MKHAYDYNQSLGYLTGLTNRLLNKRVASKFQEADIDLTAEQWGAILILLNREPMTQRQLGEQLFLDKSSVSRLTDGLEKRGWIERIRNPKDARQNIVTPTQSLLDEAENCSAIAQTVLREAQAGLTEEEKRLWQSLLSKIITNLRELS